MAVVGLIAFVVVVFLDEVNQHELLTIALFDYCCLFDNLLNLRLYN